MKLTRTFQVKTNWERDALRQACLDMYLTYKENETDKVLIECTHDELDNLTELWSTYLDMLQEEYVLPNIDRAN